MDKLTTIRIKYNNNQISSPIPIGVFADAVEWKDNQTLKDVIGQDFDLNSKGSIQSQLDSKMSNQQFAAYMTDGINQWMNQHISDGSAVTVDKTLTGANQAAEAQATGNQLDKIAKVFLKLAYNQYDANTNRTMITNKSLNNVSNADNTFDFAINYNGETVASVKGFQNAINKVYELLKNPLDTAASNINDLQSKVYEVPITKTLNNRTYKQISTVCNIPFDDIIAAIESGKRVYATITAKLQNNTIIGKTHLSLLIGQSKKNSHANNSYLNIIKFGSTTLEKEGDPQVLKLKSKIFIISKDANGDTQYNYAETSTHPLTQSDLIAINNAIDSLENINIANGATLTSNFNNRITTLENNFDNIQGTIGSGSSGLINRLNEAESNIDNLESDIHNIKGNDNLPNNINLNNLNTRITDEETLSNKILGSGGKNNTVDRTDANGGSINLTTLNTRLVSQQTQVNNSQTGLNAVNNKINNLVNGASSETTIKSLSDDIEYIKNANEPADSLKTLKNRITAISDIVDGITSGSSGTSLQSLADDIDNIKNATTDSEGNPAISLKTLDTRVTNEQTLSNKILGGTAAATVDKSGTPINLTTLNSRISTTEQNLSNVMEGLTKTVVLDELPEQGQEDIDYVVLMDGDYQYYKYIDNEWKLIAGGSFAEILGWNQSRSKYDKFIFGKVSVPNNALANENNYNNDILYLYVPTMQIFEIQQENGTYNWVSAGTLIPSPKNKDYFIQNESGEWGHFKYINNSFVQIGVNTYTKEEIDNLLVPINNNITTNTSNISGIQSSLSTLGNTISGLQSSVNTLVNTDPSIYTAGVVFNQASNKYMLEIYEYKNDELVQVTSSVALPEMGGGGGGSSQSSTLVVTKITESPIIKVPNSQIIIEIDYSSVDEDQQEVDGTYTLKRGNFIVMSGNLRQGRNSFNVSQFCSVGSQKFTLTVTDEYGSTNIKSWTVQIVDVRLESNFNDKIAYNIGSNVNFTYTPYGAISKTVHFKLDGQLLDTITTSASGILQSYTLSSQPHGAHLLECWITAVVNGVNIETQHVYKDIIWYDETSSVPVIGCIYRYDYRGVLDEKQYNTLVIPYVVFDPRDASPEVSLKENDVTKSVLELTINDNTWNYKSSEPTTYKQIINQQQQIVHDPPKKLTIKCGETSVDIYLNIIELDYKISPITANLGFDFNPVGRSNNDQDRLWKNFNYDSQTDTGVKMTVSNNFDWSNGGYKTDSENNQYFCVKSGNRAYINYNLFGTNPKLVGNEFKIIFKVTNVKDKDAVFLSCLSNDAADKAGLKMCAHEAYYYTSSDELYQPYSEDDIIEYEYNVLPIADINNPGETSFVMTYEDGVASRPLIYSNNEGYRLYQLNPTGITIGSDDCDIWIYRMKAYESALTDVDILQNFIADARDPETMINRYQRNQIYDENQALTPEHLAEVCPDLKIIKISCPHFTNDKKDYVKYTNVECIHKNGDPVLDNWYFENGYHAGQGTTSNRYGLAGRNIDIIFGFTGQKPVLPQKNVDFDDTYISTLTLGDGTKITDGSGKITLTRNSVPNNWFNIKVNIASSENANNALLQKRYNDFLPYKTPGQKRNPKIKNSMEFVNCVIFIQENSTDTVNMPHREFADNNWHFYALGNIGDSKKTDNTRVNDPTDPKEHVVEISDNTGLNSYFDSGVYYDANRQPTYNYNNAVLNESLTIPSMSIYPISTAQWNGFDGYTAVTDPTLLISKNLKIFYELKNGSYSLTQDTSINSSKTYYMRNYRNKKYESLYIDIYKHNDQTGKNDQISGWDTSFEFRYDMGTKDGQTITDQMSENQQNESKQVWRDMYEFVVTSSNENFVSHFKDWFITESFLYWYLFTERYTMIDNRAKNSFWHWGKTYITQAEALEMGDDAVNYIIDDAAAAINNGYRYDLWNYDDDTALGIDNNGQLNMTYGKEDIDYKKDNDPSSGYIFNAANSTIWRRIRQLFNPELRAMYRSRQAVNCWSAESLINEFDNWQAMFPEELVRLDYERKYFRPYYVGNPVAGIASNSDFLQNMMNGRKKYQRRQFEREQQIYIGTKYFGINQCADSEAISFRCNTPNEAVVRPDYTLKIIPYSDMYLWVKYGNTEAQGKRAKAGIEYTFTTSLEKMDDTMILILCAKNIQAINDLSACYIRANDFSSAKKLRTLIIGSDIPGYNNPFITTLSINGESNLPLLETLDLRNCSNLSGSLDFSRCSNLVTLLAEGTSIQGVSFARNGKIQIIHLPETLNALTLLNLYNISDLDIESFDALNTFISEYSNVNTLSLVNEAINSLRVVKIKGINWTLPSTNLLKQIYNKNESQLSGDVYIEGYISEKEIARYNTAWPELVLHYDPNNIIKTWEVQFRNSVTEEILYIQEKQSGEKVDIPEISEVPQKETTAQYQYVYQNAWVDEYDTIYVYDDPALNENLQNYVYRDLILYPKYEQIERTYTVRWFKNRGDLYPLESKNVRYGEEAVYPATDLPIDQEFQSNEKGKLYKLFTGWDKSTGCIDEHIIQPNNSYIDVYPIWEAVHFGEIQREKSLSERTRAEIYAIHKERAALQSDHLTANYISRGDWFDLPLGWDFNFSNIQSQVLLQNFYLDGTNFFEKDVQLLNPEIGDFTLAIEYEFSQGNRQYSTLFSCGTNDGRTGLRLVLQTNPVIRYGNNQYLRISYGYGDRSIVIFRHKKGSNTINIYYPSISSTVTNYTTNVTQGVLNSTIDIASTDKICFGNVKQHNTYIGQDYVGKGWIHWAKIWYGDLGRDVARKLASHTHHKIKMKYEGSSHYFLSETNGTMYSDGSYVAATLLPKLYHMNTSTRNYQGWSGSEMRIFLRYFAEHCLDYGWQSMIPKVEVYSGAGQQTSNGTMSNVIITTDDKIYIPAYKELLGGNVTNQNSYLFSEALDTIPWMPNTYATYHISDNLNIYQRCFWIGLPHKENNEVRQFILSTDPTEDPNNAVQEGDIWINTSQSGYVPYIYLSAQNKNKYRYYGGRLLTDSNNISAYNGGYWIRGYIYYTRTPAPGNSFYTADSQGYINYWSTIDGTAYRASQYCGVLIGLNLI